MKANLFYDCNGESWTILDFHSSITFFISIFYFCSLLRPLFFYDSGSRLSIIWLFTVQRYGGSVRYQTPGDALFG